MKRGNSKPTFRLGSVKTTSADAAPSKLIRHLNQIELSRRWTVSPRTVERWRWQKKGPRYLKVGGRVAYRIEDIEAYEAENAREAGR